METMSTSDAGRVHPTEVSGLTSGKSPHAVPDAVRKRFLKIDDDYYFPDRSLAFRDLGEKLTVRTNNLAVVHSIVAIAQARGWTAVEITGTREFKRSLWQEASSQGIKVRGYQPDASELERQRRKMPRERDDARRDVDIPTGRHGSKPPAAPPREFNGELLAHAAAPYRFDPKQRLSYYVSLSTPQGERTLWGADLERAIAESRSGVRIGDRVTLREGESQETVVQVDKRNDRGELVGSGREKVARRSWSIETTGYLDTLQDKARVFRDESRPQQAMLAQYPDLAGAVEGLRHASTFAKQITDRPDDQLRVVHAIRESLAKAIEGGATISPPYMRQHAPTVAEPAPSGSAIAARRIADPEHARG